MSLSRNLFPLHGWGVEVGKETVQDLDRVRGVLKAHKHLEQPGERCILPDKEARSIDQRADTLPAFGAIGTRGLPLACFCLLYTSPSPRDS